MTTNFSAYSEKAQQTESFRNNGTYQKNKETRNKQLANASVREES